MSSFLALYGQRCLQKGPILRKRVGAGSQPKRTYKPQNRGLAEAFSNLNPGMPNFSFPDHCETQALALWRWRTPAGCHPPMICSVNTRIQGAGPKIVPGYTFSNMNPGMPSFLFPGHCETQTLALWRWRTKGRKL